MRLPSTLTPLLIIRLVLGSAVIWLAGCAVQPQIPQDRVPLAQAPLAPGQLPPVVTDALARAGIPQQSVGIYVQEVGGNKTLVDINAALPLNPASTMKLITTQAALELLGPTYSWKTQAYADGPQSGDVLRGDLIFKGGGDPKLVLEKFWLFLRQIRWLGVREIQGDVLLDRSLFQETFYDATLFDGEPFRSYNAGPDALLLNYKTLSFRFFPDASRGLVAMLVDPPLAGYTVMAPRLAQGDCGDWQSRLQATFDVTSTVFRGSMAAACGPKTWHVHPYQITHDDYFGAVFRQMWRDLGGTFAGKVKSGIVPPTARLLAEWESGALSEVIRDINKYSNNVMARQLLLTLAAHGMPLPATTEGGAAVIRAWLATKGIVAPELVIENGSGLSRGGRISAGTMGRMLAAAFRTPTMPEFISSLSLVGFDGTMRKRLKTNGVAGQAHVKTGSLNEVRAVAGYVLAASGRRYVVVCLVNHLQAGSAREAQDGLLQWVYERG